MAAKSKAKAKPEAKAKKAPAPFAIPRSVLQPFALWIEGTSPLVVHAWSLKAKSEMLRAQGGADEALAPEGRAARDPDRDFQDSVYKMDGGYGFPVTGLKASILDRAHKDKGLARTDVRSALFLDFTMHQAKTANVDAVCSMPLVRLIAGEPEMREDMVKVGPGLAKKATLAYRAQFWPWAIHLRGKFNVSVLSEQSLAFLVEDAGMASGIGEWRVTRSGIMGAFRICPDSRAKLWLAFAEGRGRIPSPPSTSFDMPIAAE
jgi:hypothetical protein